MVKKKFSVGGLSFNHVVLLRCNMMEQNKKKKKLNLNTVGLLLLVVIVAAYFYLWQAKTNASVQVMELSNNVTISQLQIKKIILPAGDLSSKLATVTAALAAAQTGFPVTVDRNEVIDYILSTAGVCKIQILPLVSDGWVTQNTGREYRVLKFTATAEGRLKDVETFMTALQEGDYPTLVISEFTVIRKDTAAPGFPGSEMQVTVTMKIGIYTAVSQVTGDTIK
jgi:hypothetical protein